MIRGIPEVRLIGHDGSQVGIVPLQQAQDLAREKDLDLVEISPTANPPVCKIMDYGKYVFQQKKKEGEAKKKQKVIVV
ncbi:MAG: translation initiation factor IF-3, partial [Thermoanaerobaculia bacterium]